jgi:hypothetical protein
MPLPILEIIGMSLRKTPVGKIRKALAMCEEAGLAVTARDLESHHLCGRDPVVLADALVTANRLGVETSFQEMSAVILAGHNPNELLLDASKTKTVRFDTFSPKREDRIRGFTRDQREVFAAVTAVFRLSPSQLAFRFDFRHIHERLSAAVCVYINTAPDFRSLQMKKSEQEAELRFIGADMIPSFTSVAIDYQ